MPSAPSILVILFAVLLGLWPVACLAVLLRHAWARQWRRAGQVALLLPLWTIGASVGLIQLAPFLAAPVAGKPAAGPFVAATGLAVALCFGVLAWWLLIRSLAAAAADLLSSGQSSYDPPRASQG